VREGVSERESEIERERERERESERERKSESERESRTQTETERDRDRKRERARYIYIENESESEKERGSAWRMSTRCAHVLPVSTWVRTGGRHLQMPGTILAQDPRRRSSTVHPLCSPETQNPDP